MSQILDAIDRNIIRLLRLDARMSSTKMAEVVGLSPSACLRRIRMMEQSGIIRGYTALIGSGEEGRTIAVMINITLDRQTEDSLNRFEDAVRKHPEIRECYLMTGDWDYFLRVEVESPKEFEAIHTDILSKLPGVTRIHSSFSIRNALMARGRRS